MRKEEEMEKTINGDVHSSTHKKKERTTLYLCSFSVAIEEQAVLAGLLAVLEHDPPFLPGPVQLELLEEKVTIYAIRGGLLMGDHRTLEDVQQAVELESRFRGLALSQGDVLSGYLVQGKQGRLIVI